MKTLTITHTAVESGTPTLQFTTSRRVAGNLQNPFLVAIEYAVDGGAWQRPRNDIFIAAEDSEDDADPSQVVTFTAVGFVPWLLQRALLHWSASAKNGERVWHEGGNPASAGYIVAGMMAEAKARGWGAMLSTDFTGSKDSNDETWPSGDKVMQPYRLLTPLSTVLGGLSDQGLCEWWAEGFTLRMFVAGSGDVKPVVLGGRGYTRMPVKRSFNDVFTHLTVVPEKARYWLYLTNIGASDRFGRLEATMTQSGVEDHPTATRLAQPALLGGRSVKRELAYEWTVAGSLPAPWRDFNIGDQLEVRTSGGRLTQRVVGLVVSKQDTVTVRAVVGSKLLTLNARTIRRAGAASMGGMIGGSGSGLPAASGPVSAVPDSPASLHVEANEGYFAEDGTARAKVKLAWNAVLTADDGSEIDVVEYDVWHRLVDAVGSRSTTTEGLSVTLDSWESGVERRVKVRARSVGGVWGPFSDETSVTPATPVMLLDPPTVPVLTVEQAVVTVTWDGELESGAPGPSLRHVFVERGPSDTGPWARVGQTLEGAGGVVVPSSDDIGETVWFRLVAVDTLGRLSDPSDPASIEVTSEIVEAVQEAQDAAEDAMLAAAAAQTTANGKNRRFARTTAPALPADAPLTQGDEWVVLNGSGQTTGVQTWNGSAWVPSQLLADSILVPGSAGTVSIADSAVTAPKIFAGAVTTAKLAASAVTADKVDAGAVQSQHLNVGAKVPQGAPTDRVPAPPTDGAYWGPVIAGTVPLGSQMWNVSFNGTGIGFYPGAVSAGLDARIEVTTLLPVPKSGRIHVDWQCNVSSQAVTPRIHWYTAAGVLDGWSTLTGGYSGSQTMDVAAGRTHYKVVFFVPVGGNPSTLVQARVFEVIGTAPGAPRAELAPTGLALYDGDGADPVVSLASNRDDVVSISKRNASGELVPVATIDQDGHGQFAALATDTDLELPGGLLAGSYGDLTWNGQLLDTPFLERGPRGTVWSAGLGTDAAGRLIVNGVTAEFQGLGIGTALLHTGRRYRIGFDTTWFSNWVSGSGSAALVLELWVGSSAQNVATPNGSAMRFTLLESSDANGAMRLTAPSVSEEFTASGQVYILARLVNASGRSYRFYNIDREPQIFIRDEGPNIAAIDGGSIKTRATAGNVAPPNPVPKTATFQAAWSRSWNSAGSAPWGSSGSMYQDGRMLWSGGADWPRTAQVGFGALGLSGKTIRGMWLELQNRHTGNASGATVNFGTHGNASAPSGSRPSRVNGWDSSTGKGQLKRHPIPSGLWAGFAAGTYRGVQLGNAGTGSWANYCAFDGFDTTNATGSGRYRPRLIVSYLD